MQKIALGLLIVLISCLLGCYASITRSGYGMNDLQTNLSPCTDIIIKKKASLPEDIATVVGKIKAEDSGFSFVCSEEYVIGIFRKDACALGANIVNVIEEKHPDFWSSCYRAEADLLRCKDKNLLANIKSDPRYAPELVTDRSKVTAIMNAAGLGMIGGGIIGGAIAAGVTAAVVAPGNLSDQNASGWRLPVLADLGNNSEWRKENAELYLTAKGDFDGDGENDGASLLINDKENKTGLFVTLASRTNSPPILLESINDKQAIKGIGIRVVSPDHYKTACGKGYRVCKPDEPSEIQINYPAIDLFQYESSNSFFVWDGKENNFKKIWMSDCK